MQTCVAFCSFLLSTSKNRSLMSIGCAGMDLLRARHNLTVGDLDTGLTNSDFAGRNTVMVISLTSSPAEFLNSWLHEMRHLSRHIEQACGISPYGEEAAYLAEEIGQRMFPVAKRFICEHCKRNWLMEKYIDTLINEADGMKYCDFYRLLSVIYWNLNTE